MAEVQLDLAGVAAGATLSEPPRASGLVLFAHGSGSSRFSPRNRAVADVLHAAGFATLLVDLLPEEGSVDRRFDIELLGARVTAAADWAGRRGLPLGLFGASTGAAAALVAAAERPEVVRAVVSRGGRPDLAGDALPRVQAPTLLIVGGADVPVIRVAHAGSASLPSTRAEAALPKRNLPKKKRPTKKRSQAKREIRLPAPNDDDRVTRSWDDYLQEGGWSEDFAFIAGFTSGGMPYGTTWEAMEAIERQQELARAEAQRRRERPPQRLAVELAALEAVFHGGWWDEIRSYLDAETGAVIELDDLAERSGEAADEQAALRERIHSDRERYLELDTSISLLPTRDEAQQFIREVEDSGLRRRLARALAARRKPWRRFREVLTSDSGELDRWRRLEWRVRRERLAEHLRDLGIEAVFDGPAEPTR